MYWTLLRTLRPLGAILALSAAVFAQTPDQVNDPTPDTNFGCGADGSLLNGAIRQSFVPEADSLVAVELRLAAGPGFPSGGLSAGERGTILRVRLDSPTNGSASAPENVLVEATTTIPGPLTAGDSVLVRWEFDEIALTPGTTYYLEWVTPATDVILGWQGLSEGTYDAGQAFNCYGTPWPGGGVADFNFITYAAGSVETAEECCADLIAAMSAEVEAMDLSGHKARWLSHPLAMAQHFLDQGKLWHALMAVRMFEHRMRVLAHFRMVGSDAAKSLRKQAKEARHCLGQEIKALMMARKAERKAKHEAKKKSKTTDCGCS